MFEDLIAKVREEVDCQFPLIGEGRNRAVYDRGDGTVLKVPSNEMGFIDNAREAAMREPFPMAKCHLAHIHDVPCLIMERVSMEELPWGHMPEWASWVDCFQVGYTAEGALVAFDYA